jgi:microcystin-dependent protein
MSLPYIGEIQLMSVNYAPSTWALCDGAELPVNQHTPLFALIGLAFGGHATSYRLPNLMGRVPCGAGAGPGLAGREVGEVLGENTVSLYGDQTASHTHAMIGVFERGIEGKLPVPYTQYYLTNPSGGTALALNAPADTPFDPAAVGEGAGGEAHENRQPFVALTYVIALDGIFPSFP